jgi:hypothetical protein
MLRMKRLIVPNVASLTVGCNKRYQKAMKRASHVSTEPLTLVLPTQPDGDPPSTLGETGRGLWARVMREYQITDCGGQELLHQACAAADRCAALSAQISADGEVIRTKSGLKSHPCIRDEIQCRALICRIIRSLGLDVEPVRAMSGRPGQGFGWKGDD